MKIGQLGWEKIDLIRMFLVAMLLKTKSLQNFSTLNISSIAND